MAANQSAISNTFSIVALDAKNGLLGSAVASLFLGVGAVVPHLVRGVGAVNTQHHHQVVLAERALALMAQGVAPEEALKLVLAGDAHPEERQLLAIDVRGRKAAHTGSACQAARHHRIGRHCVAAGNTLAGPEVIEAMVATFDAALEQDAGTPDRGGQFMLHLVAALEAGQAVGGDKRGKQAAGVRVISAGAEETVNGMWDLRVDDHPEPLAELRRMVEARVARESR